MILQKSPPENFLSGTGDEEQQEEDENFARSLPQKINPPDLGFRAGENVGGQKVPCVKKKIQNNGGKETEEKRPNSQTDLRSLKE
jgi:hypothetical protein